MSAALMEMHQAHKARQARIAARAYQAPVLVVAAEPEAVPELEAVEAPAPFPQIDIPDFSAQSPWFRMADSHLTIRDIQQVVMRCFGISRVDLLSPRRQAHVVLPRQIAMYFCKLITLRSFPEIGRQFANRDHTTILHAVRKIERALPLDPDLAQTVAEIELILNAIEEARHESRNANPSDEIIAGSDKATLGTTGESPARLDQAHA